MSSGIDTKDKLLKSALDLIHTRSYANVGVQELCERAGVQKGSFYHFFPTKRALTIAALERQWDIAKQKVWDPAFAGTLPLRRKLERCFDLFYELQCSVRNQTGQLPGCPFGNLALELSTQDEAIRRKIDQIFRENARFVEGILDEAIAAGELPGQDTSATAETVLAYIEGVLLLAKTRNDPHLIKELKPGALRLLEAGLAITEKPRSGTRRKKGV